MNEATITALIQLGGLATQAALEYLRAPPRDDGEARARDVAVLAMMEQARALGDALQAEHGEAPVPPASVSIPSMPAHEAEPPGLVQTHLTDNAHDARRAMAATIWGEARSEPLAGRIAVGWVVRNRAADPGWWGKDVRTCCLSPAQFSAYSAAKRPPVPKQAGH
jgi:hypothetical protein